MTGVGSLRTGSLKTTAGLLVAVVATLVIATAHPRGQTQGATRPRINTLIERLASGGVAESGDVWTFIDMEHQPYDILGLRKRFEEFGAKRKPNGQLQSTPIIRIPPYGSEVPDWFTKQVLDSGALGIVFPQIDTKEQALRAIRAMRYPPQRGTKYPTPAGIRGYGPGGTKALWGDLAPGEYLEKADLWPLNPDGELIAIVMVESPTSIKNLPDILDVPGIGAVFVGVTDLSMNLGVGVPKGNSDTPSPEVDAALRQVAKTCQAKKVVCGVAANWATKVGRQKLIDLGYRLLL